MECVLIFITNGCGNAVGNACVWPSDMQKSVMKCDTCGKGATDYFLFSSILFFLLLLLASVVTTTASLNEDRFGR